MESIAINLNDAEKFDSILKDSLPEGGDLQIITKNGATVGGQPAVMFAFSVQLPDGSLKKAQIVTTLRLVTTILRALEQKYS